MANYSLGRKPIPDVENGHKFTGDNFTMLVPHTPILAGKTGLIFENCNLTNCDIPWDSILIGCSPYHVSFCTNVHPSWVNKGLNACLEVCDHVVDSDSITIDGQDVGTTYHYEDTVV